MLFAEFLRLQVLTPLSLLINIATVMVCTLVINPNLGTFPHDVQGSHVLKLRAAGEISKLYPASIAPQPSMIAIYLVMIYLGQIGYCVLLVLARKPETKVPLIA